MASLSPATDRALVDSFGRVHTSLRISVTDRCNIRCFYCMPAGDLQFQPREQLLTFEEIERFVRVSVGLGIDKYRLTGGEPLVRQELTKLVRMLVRVKGVREVALTTNAMLLAEHAQALKQAGLHRINVSLDTLNAERFAQITRRRGLEQALQGIAAAKDAGFDKIRINAVAIRGITEQEIIDLVNFSSGQGLHVRFIEYMPLDADTQWTHEQVLSGADIRRIINEKLGDLVPTHRTDPAQPAVDYELVRRSDSEVSRAMIGFISSVSETFCGNCNRLRLTADGQVRNCLFSTNEWDARALIRSGETDRALERLISACVAAKKPGHGIDEPDFLRPHRAMYQIGG